MEEGLTQELAQVTALYDLIVAYLVTYSFQILGSAVIMVIGLYLARRISDLVLRICQKRELDITLSRFFASCTRIAIIASAVIIVLPKLGIQITPFIAAIGAMGLAAGLAVQGLLSNYGAGLSIILARPFVVGDTIRIQGVWGIVKEVHLAYTALTNEDGELITIPNKHIVGEIIHNSQQDTCLELEVGVAYDSDMESAIAAIRKKFDQIPNVSKERAVQIGIDKFADSAINIGIRCWVATEYLHESRFQCNMAIYQALQDAGVTIPFSQHEVRLLQ